MDPSDIFRIVNLVVGASMLGGGIGQFFPAKDIGVQTVVVAIYLIIFGAGTALLEFQIPPPISKYASFMFSFIGRGIFYIFVGSVTMGNHAWNYIVGSVIVLVGIGYVALEFVPSIEPPANMRDADPSWGQEQI